jgi:16S rRNA C967 or C1407 C5-methylase (RsmB/RsmF family)
VAIDGVVMTSSPLRSEKLDLRLTPAAKQTLADQQSFQLKREQWEAFVAALDAPPQRHPRLERLLQEPSVLERGVAEQPPAGGVE